MSLLLDALKKAAEQKAAKTRDDETESDAGLAEETALDATAVEARDGDADDSSIPRHRLEDETELDHTELDTRLERTLTERQDGTETSLDAPDGTETRAPSPPEQISSGEDETLVFAEDDVTEFGSEDSLFQSGAAGEPTGFTQTEFNEDETDLTQMGFPEDETEFTQQVPGAEQTELTEGPSAEQTELTQREPSENETETNLTESSRQTAASDVTDLGGPSPPGDSEKTQRQSNVGEDSESDRTETRVDDTMGLDDDMSLMLVEREQTQLTGPTSVTDPQQPQDTLEALRKKAPTSAYPGQQDTTLDKTGRDQTSTTDAMPTRGGVTSTTSPTTATQSTRATLSPRDVTDTHTYAPDNYDRTLMRLPNDDASKLFAGMKSDSDVVMTPDYAKQVFRSKSSAQRVQHYKFYSGIAIVILLAIGTYSVFEYQSESEVIDSSLISLKRDPMPGIIRSADGEQPAEPLFAGAQVDERALEIIQSAQDDEPVPEERQTSETAVSGQSTPGESEPERAVDTARGGESPAAEDTAAGDKAASAAAADGTTILASASEPSASAAGSSASTMQIQTGNRHEEKHLLLREAYDAYQSGNDALALQRYSRVLEIDPANRNALLARAAIRVQNGNTAAAIEDYQILLLANPKDSLATASLIAVANYSPGEMETQLKLMIREEPDSPYLNFALANAYSAQNRWQEAQGHYYKALQNNPDDPNYAYNLAVSLEHISQPRAAVSYYRRALENYNKGLATFSRDVVDRRLEKLAQP